MMGWKFMEMSMGKPMGTWENIGKPMEVYSLVN